MDNLPFLSKLRFIIRHNLSCPCHCTPFPRLLTILESTTAAWFYHQSTFLFCSLRVDHVRNWSVCLRGAALHPTLHAVYSPMYWEMKLLLKEHFESWVCASSLAVCRARILILSLTLHHWNTELLLNAFSKKKGIYRHCYPAVGLWKPLLWTLHHVDSVNGQMFELQ